MTFPSMMLAVILILCLFEFDGRCLPQGLAKNPGIAIDRDLLHPRGGAGQNPDPGLGHTEPLGQQFRDRAVGLAAVGDGANPDLDHAAPVGERLNAVDVVAAAARSYPQCNADALGGIAPRIHWLSMKRPSATGARNQMTLG